VAVVDEELADVVGGVVVVVEQEVFESGKEVGDLVDIAALQRDQFDGLVAIVERVEGPWRVLSRWASAPGERQDGDRPLG
jgi:hypothetical protein